mmetsp:Transcript_28286/g.82717  ORF Transcript_28286/g.82717 Transcript_28286/m.82717 type:complete len:201 (-) Transcript_28286:12-614(-)
MQWSLPCLDAALPARASPPAVDAAGVAGLGNRTPWAGRKGLRRLWRAPSPWTASCWPWPRWPSSTSTFGHLLNLRTPWPLQPLPRAVRLAWRATPHRTSKTWWTGWSRPSSSSICRASPRTWPRVALPRKASLRSQRRHSSLLYLRPRSSTACAGRTCQLPSRPTSTPQCLPSSPCSAVPSFRRPVKTWRRAAAVPCRRF